MLCIKLSCGVDMVRFIFILNFIISLSLFAEVQEVSFTWNAAICRDQCTPNLTRQLKQIRGVSSFTIDEHAGRASLVWNPNEQFSFGYLNMASRLVGFRIIDTRVVVRGTVTRIGDDFYLISLGDQTKFRLLGPLQTDPSRYTIKYNIANHPLPFNMRDKLIEAQRRLIVVTITGALFEPQRYDLMLVIVKIEFPEEKNDRRAADRAFLRTGHYESRPPPIPVPVPVPVPVEVPVPVPVPVEPVPGEVLPLPVEGIEPPPEAPSANDTLPDIIRSV